MKFPLVPLDKANHAIYGAGIYAIVASAEKLFSVPMHEKIALGVVCVMAVLKEVSDRLIVRRQVSRGVKPTHTADGLDALATVLGALTLYLSKHL